MIWLPQFDDIIDRARGAVGGFDALKVDDPQAGRIEGTAAFDSYRMRADAWLRERGARSRPIATTVGERRTVGEFEVELTLDHRTVSLPVAIAVEPGKARQDLWVRIYHSQWPLLGHHVVRPPLLSMDPSVHESDIVGEYQAALAAGDAARIVATFEQDGCFREPAGGEFRVCGASALTEFFSRFFSAGGGIILEHCTVTEDGTRTALEFNAVRWGGVDLPPQAGIAVYERGSSGRIAAARVYDDVEGPVE
jgi:hypothetical protein